MRRLPDPVSCGRARSSRSGTQGVWSRALCDDLLRPLKDTCSPSRFMRCYRSGVAQLCRSGIGRLVGARPRSATNAFLYAGNGSNSNSRHLGLSATVSSAKRPIPAIAGFARAFRPRRRGPVGRLRRNGKNSRCRRIVSLFRVDALVNPGRPFVMAQVRLHPSGPRIARAGSAPGIALGRHRHARTRTR